MMETIKNAISGDDQSVSSKRLVGVGSALIALLILLVGCIALFLGRDAAGFCALAGVAGGLSGGALGFSAWESKAKIDAAKTTTVTATPTATTTTTTPTVTAPTTTTATLPADKIPAKD
jgi:hypothetical protein